MQRSSNDQESVPLGDQPLIAETALECHFSFGFQAASIYVDTAAGDIHFRQCHVPRRILASPDAWYSCPITDLKGVYPFRYRGETLTIITAAGKAQVPQSATNYAQLRETLCQARLPNQSGFATDHPLMGLVYLAGATIGLTLGFLSSPQNAADYIVGAFVLAAAAAGVIASHALVYGADRYFKIALVEPIGCAMIGACFGIGLGSVLPLWIGWKLTPILSVILISGVLGLTYGIVRQARRRQTND